MKFFRLAHIIPLVIILIASLYYLGGARVKQEDHRYWPGREELFERLFNERRLLFVYGASRPEFAARYQAFAENYKNRSRRLNVTIKSDRETTSEDLKNNAVYLVGTPASNHWLRKLSARLPVKFEDGGFELFGKAYRDSSDVISLFYPNPENPQLPLQVLSGNRDDEVLAFELFRQSSDYRIVRRGNCIALGSFAQEEGRRWAFDSANHHDFAAETKLAKETAHFRFHTHGFALPAEELDQLASTCEQNYQRLTAFFGNAAALPAIDYHLYASFEEKGLITSNTQLAHCDLPRREVHVMLSDWISGTQAAHESDLLLRLQLGAPKHLVLETGLRIYFSENWRKRGYAFWASKLFLSGNLPALADLLDNQMLQNESDLVMEPLAATLVAFLLENWGREKFLQNYAHWSPAPEEAAALETAWHKFLSAMAQEQRAAIAAAHKDFPKATSFQKGFCHAHEGYQIHNGYLSRKSDEALAKLARLGTNAVSLTPFTSIENPQTPEFFRLWRSAGSENDESVIHAANSAHALGMAVMLKPHIWVGRGSWPGDIAMTTPQDWQLFFDYYYRWMRHYALLAEMYDMEILCLGVELSQATVGHEQEWRAMIAKLRRLYSGEMTYAANWGNEFENLAFWDALDFMGVNCYYPLSEKDNASDADLRAGATAVVERIAAVAWRFRKPVLFTEIGFTSTNAPWKQPHAEVRGSQVNLSDQARCYEAMFQALSGKFWCRGIYWWKWPSYLDYGGPADNEFTPNNKPAEQIVANWYQKAW